MAALCPVCSQPGLPGEKYCEECGTPLGAELCAVCGAGAVDPDGYCGRCGVRQPSGRDHIEIDHVAGATRVAGVSDRGLRHSRNEDAMALTHVGDDSAPTIVGIVCDGVSTSPRPDEASQTAADIGAAVLAKQLREGIEPVAATGRAVQAAAQAVAGLAASEYEAPACTLVSAVVSAEHVTVGWVGDSRAYWLAGPGSAALTRDDAGLGHVLTAWLGADAGEVTPHVQKFAPEGPGVVLVCSDGLWNYYPDATTLADAVPDAATDPLGAARTLVTMAIESGGRDNITVLVIPFTGRRP
ncbi:protein phosphatase 2C domain-containing protein [Thermopolyspora sp. NPDC052614]|uniref:PP2C family serine/threonine-protein phosphatase n=1 Tax=Thermopolyspora sp. NPDC052614 TaxID=3155682 RepID=UPI00344AE412